VNGWIPSIEQYIKDKTGFRLTLESTKVFVESGESGRNSGCIGLAFRCAVLQQNGSREDSIELATHNGCKGVRADTIDIF